ncbi:MAG: HAD family phosphatase [Actinomycetota bacterium]
MSETQRVGAVVFDFDGTIIDTETPVYESWRDAFLEAGVEPIDLAVWSAQVGKASGDSLDERVILCERLGADEVPPEIEAFRKNRRDEMMRAQPVRAGVVAWLDACDAARIPLAIGSSSPTEWVDTNLRRVGLRDRFRSLSCADPGIPGKPDPTVYRRACEALGVETGAALAIEDSPNGVRAAIDAGMRCIAAPGPITAGADFSHATIAVTSLSALDPADWLR